MDSISFRDAYTDGVDKYYTLNGNTYRNPHESGVIKSLRSILDVLIPRSHPSSSTPIHTFSLPKETHPTRRQLTNQSCRNPSIPRSNL